MRTEFDIYVFISGSHWLFEIISMLTSGKLEFSRDCVTDSHIDLEDSESFEKKPDPRILHTHLPYPIYQINTKTMDIRSSILLGTQKIDMFPCSTLP